MKPGRGKQDDASASRGPPPWLDPNSPGDGSYLLTLSTPVPEPASAWRLAIGLAALGTRAWRGRR